MALKSRFDLIRPACRLKASGEVVGCDQLITACFEIWIEDQFLYDVTNYKSRMLGCYAKDFYSTSNDTKFVAAL